MIPCVFSKPLMRLVCAVLSWIRRWRSRNVRRASSCSTVGTRTSLEDLLLSARESHQPTHHAPGVNSVRFRPLCAAINK